MDYYIHVRKISVVKTTLHFFSKLDRQMMVDIHLDVNHNQCFWLDKKNLTLFINGVDLK